MRPEIYALIALIVLPVNSPQRGVVSGVAVPKSPAQVGVPVDITVTGTNPCGAVRINPGDGTEPITHPLEQVPATRQHVYRKPGRFEVRAEGMGNCDGVVATSIQVNPAPAPAPPPAPPPAPSPGRIGDDEVIVRAVDRWTNTGVSVRAGDVIRIESAGTVQLSADAADTSSPGGAGSGRRAPSAPMPDRPAGGLIARIGNSRPLYVGAERTLRANASGQLYLGVNDDHVADNHGEFRVKIEPPRGRYRR